MECANEAFIYESPYTGIQALCGLRSPFTADKHTDLER